MILKDKNLYFVGGVVRDEIMNKKSADIDLCYEGNAIEFASKFEILKINQNLGTVKVLVDGNEIDIASTRTESYPRKGHLPAVNEIGCSLKDDLRRRDFTVNSIAKRTTDNEIIDCYGGYEDIKKGILKVLHPDSFSDDPTRIVRGLKFSVRFGFTFDDETLSLQKKYLDNVNYDMSYHRLKKELVDSFNINKQEVFKIFVNEKMYKLIPNNSKVPEPDLPIEDYTRKIQSDYLWLIWLSFFNLDSLPLTRYEKRILNCAEKLRDNPPNNNTPFESVIINSIRKECGV